MSERPPSTRSLLGRNVWVLGLVSLFTDVSSEMVYPVLPLFLAETLRTPMPIIGLIEGTVESVASLLRLWSGHWSDRSNRRRPFVVVGYALAAVSKPLLALATGWPHVLAVRLIDRAGKGLRGPPRDAMLVRAAPQQHRGLAFGLHRAMDSAGAVLGSLITLGLLTAGFAYHAIFLIAGIPSALALMTLLWLERAKTTAGTAFSKVSRGTCLPPELRRFYFVVAIFALGNSSDVFLLLRARELGYSATWVILCFVFYNVTYAAASAPAGWLSDYFDRRRILVVGYLLFAVTYGGFAIVEDTRLIWLLLALYGVYAAITEGVAKAYLADLSEPQLHGTHMGILQAINGALMLLASTAGGALWGAFGASWTFIYGAGCAAIAALLLVSLVPKAVTRDP